MITGYVNVIVSCFAEEENNNSGEYPEATVTPEGEVPETMVTPGVTEVPETTVTPGVTEVPEEEGAPDVPVTPEEDGTEEGEVPEVSCNTGRRGDARRRSAGNNGDSGSDRSAGRGRNT